MGSYTVVAGSEDFAKMGVLIAAARKRGFYVEQRKEDGYFLRTFRDNSDPTSRSTVIFNAAPFDEVLAYLEKQPIARDMLRANPILPAEAKARGLCAERGLTLMRASHAADQFSLLRDGGLLVRNVSLDECMKVILRFPRDKAAWQQFG